MTHLELCDTTMSSWQTTPDQTLVNGIEKVIPQSRWILTLAIDAIVFFLLAVRPYSTQPYQMVVIHYYGFVITTDVMALFLSARRRFWYHVFVAVGSAGILQCTIYLYCVGLDGGNDQFSFLRIFFLVVRLINAASCVKSYGPWLQHWIGLYKYARKVYDLSGPNERKVYKQLMKDVVAIFVLSLAAYNAHWNYGEKGIDAPLVAMQGNVVFSLRVKIVVLALLIATPFKLGTSMLVFWFFSVGSYVLMPSMYLNAPLTFVPHVVGDLTLCKLMYDIFHLVSPGGPFDPESKRAQLQKS